MTRAQAILLNALGLYGIAFVLVFAFLAQVLLHELPCPLCLLQRIMFAMVAIGPILNVRHGPRPSHYALSLLAAVIGAVVSGRQVLLHILPGDPGYGSALFGYHFYTWAFIAFASAIVLIALVMLFERPFEQGKKQEGYEGGSLQKEGSRGGNVLQKEGDGRPDLPHALAQIAVGIVVGLTALNAVSALLECGLAACPDNPTVYRWLVR